MGAFEDAVKKKEDELKTKKASAEERLNYPDFLEQSNPTYRLAQDLPIKGEPVVYQSWSKPVVYQRSGPNAKMREAMRDAGRGIELENMKEEERGKAMKKYADMKEK